MWWSNLNKHRNKTKTPALTEWHITLCVCVKGSAVQVVVMCTHSDQNSWKNDEAVGVGNPACCVWTLVGRKNTAWLGQHYSSLQTQSMSWSLNVNREKMADKEEWEEMKQEACVSPLGPPPSCYIHSLFFTMEQKGGKKDIFVACMCVWLFIPIRGSVFFLHYLSSLSSEQFYFQPII